MSGEARRAGVPAGNGADREKRWKRYRRMCW